MQRTGVIVRRGYTGRVIEPGAAALSVVNPPHYMARYGTSPMLKCLMLAGMCYVYPCYTPHYIYKVISLLGVLY